MLPQWDDSLCERFAHRILITTQSEAKSEMLNLNEIGAFLRLTAKRGDRINARRTLQNVLSGQCRFKRKKQRDALFRVSDSKRALQE